MPSSPWNLLSFPAFCGYFNMCAQNHRWENMWCLSSWVWVISCNLIFSSSIYLPSNFIIKLLLRTYCYTYRSAHCSTLTRESFSSLQMTVATETHRWIMWRKWENGGHTTKWNGFIKFLPSKLSGLWGRRSRSIIVVRGGRSLKVC